MSPSRVASVAALAGAAAWFARGLLIWGEDTSVGGVPMIMLWLGWGALTIAVSAAGYALVATAPWWLRAVVSIAFTLLVWMIWQLVIEFLDSDWMTAVAGASGAFLAAVWGLARSRPERPEPVHARGRRAAR